MKNKSIIGLLLTLGLSALSISSCGTAKKSSVSSEHTHVYSGYQHDDHDHWQKCEECGEIINKGPHSGGTSTCVQKAICEICGAEYGELEEHQYGSEYKYEEGDDYHYQECSVCHDKKKTSHTFVREVVGDEYLVGTKKTGCEESNVYYKSCVCGAHSNSLEETFTVPNSHNFTLEEILPGDANLLSAATCTEAAIYGKVCENCHEHFSNESTFTHGEPLGHHYIHFEEGLSISSYHRDYYYCDRCFEYFIDDSEEGQEAHYVQVKYEDLFDNSKAQYGNDEYGSEEKPYVISDVDDLKFLATKTNGGDSFAGKYIVLSNDINLPKEDFGVSIGNTDPKPFSGTFDGQNYTIDGYVHEGKDAVALFSRVTNGTIKNLKLTNVGVSYTGTQRGAAVVARADKATLDNVHVLSGSINGAKQNGGLIAVVVGASTIKNCSNAASINGNDVGNGGLVGYIHAGGLTIQNSTNKGSVTGTGSSGLGTGGLVGYVLNGNLTIADSLNQGTVTSAYEGVGGVLGYIHKVTAAYTVSITGTTNEGTVDFQGTGGNGFGGIYGSNVDASNLTLKIENCINRGSITGHAHVGGIAGLPRNMAAGSYIKNCSNYGNVASKATSGAYVGGIVSRARIIIQDCACYTGAVFAIGSNQTLAKDASLKSDVSTAPGYILSVVDSAGQLIGGKLINADGSDYTA